MAAKTNSEKIAELQAMLAGLGDGTESPEAPTDEPVPIPHPLDGVDSALVRLNIGVGRLDLSSLEDSDNLFTVDVT